MSSRATDGDFKTSGVASTLPRNPLPRNIIQQKPHKRTSEIQGWKRYLSKYLLEWKPTCASKTTVRTVEAHSRICASQTHAYLHARNAVPEDPQVQPASLVIAKKDACSTHAYSRQQNH
eukprot:1640558-Pleurochrysis_carterae.AAC.2